MLRTRVAMLAHLQPSPTGVVLSGLSANARTVVAAVLNSPVDEPSVDAALRAMQRHQTRLQHTWQRPLPLATHDAQHTALPDHWLTLRIGVPERLRSALRASNLDSGATPTLLETDVPIGTTDASSPTLFGVPLHPLTGHGAVTRCIGVAALVLRPDMRTAHLITMGPWDASTSAPDVLHALQRLAREHLAQWHLSTP